MKLKNPLTGEVVVNPTCSRCMCHGMAIVFGNMENGCCDECGCPKNMKGFQWFKENRQCPICEDGTCSVCVEGHY